MNRSFWTAATSSGLVVNSPVEEVVHEEQRRDDLRAARGARQDVEGLRDGADAAVVHRRHPLPPAEGPAGDALRAVRRVRAGRRRRDAARLLADRAEHDHRPRRLPPGAGPLVLGGGVDIAVDPPSSILGGEAFLERVYDAYRSCHVRDGHERLEHGAADRLGRAGRNLRPRRSRARSRRPIRPRRPASSASRSTVPATASRRSWCRRGSSPGSVYNEEYRHTSLIATLRKTLGARRRRSPSATPRRARSITCSPARRRAIPTTWVAVEAAPVPDWALDYDVLGKALSDLGKAAGTGLIEKARAMGATLPPELDDPDDGTHPPADHRGAPRRRLALLPATRTSRHKR